MQTMLIIKKRKVSKTIKESNTFFHNFFSIFTTRLYISYGSSNSF